MPNNNQMSLLPKPTTTQFAEVYQPPRYQQEYVARQLQQCGLQMYAINRTIHVAIAEFTDLYRHGEYTAVEATTAGEMLLRSAERLMGGVSQHQRAAHEQRTLLFLSTLQALQQVAAQSLVDVVNQIPQVDTRKPTFWDYLRGAV